MSKPMYLKDNDLIRKKRIVEGKKWRKLLALKNKITNKKFLKLYGGRQSFNIYDEIELEKTISVLKETAEDIGWDLENDPVFKQAYEEIKRRETLLEKQKAILETQFKKLKEEQIKSNIIAYKGDLNEFKKIIETNSSEADIHNFLKKHGWILGSEYLDAQPITPSEFPFKDSRFDFFLQKYDTFFDIIELKVSTAPLFVGNLESETESVSRSTPMSAGLADAVSQIIHYLELATYMRAELEDIGITVYKPTGVIIMGRTKTKKELIRLKSISAYLQNIEISRYDLILQKAENFIKKLEQ